MQKHTLIIFSICALISSVVLYIALYPILRSNISLLTTDCILSGLILSICLFLLKYIVQYTNIDSLRQQQKIIFHSGLAILFIACWIGVAIAILYIIFPSNQWLLLIPIIPIRIVMGFLIYGCMIQWYQNKNSNKAEEDVDIESSNIASKNIDGRYNDLVEISQDRIAVKNGSKIDVIHISEIIYLQADGDYVTIHSLKGRFLKEQTMKSFENSLPSSRFVRVHRSSIINIDFISQIEMYSKQSQLVKMKNGAQVKVSINGYKTLKKVLQLK